MHIGIFSSILGKFGGPAVFDRRFIEAVSRYDYRNTYTVYGINEAGTGGLKLANSNFSLCTVRPSGKWFAIPFGLTLTLARRPVDLLHATLVAPPVVPGKFVMTMTCWSQYLHPEFYPPLIRWRLLYLLNRGVKNASAIFCYTRFLKDRLIERFHLDPEKIFITQPGVGDEMKPPDSQSALDSFLGKTGIRRPYILFIGTLTRRKNVAGLIRAFHILLKEGGIEHKLVLVGEKGYYHREIFETVDDLGLRGRVVFAGRRLHHELPFFYSGADVFVFPTFSEGFGLPPLEAMACGTPVVASRATAVPEVVGDAAVLVDPYSPEDMAEAIFRVISGDTLRRDLIERGMARARQFTWQKTAHQTVSAYETVWQKGW